MVELAQNGDLLLEAALRLRRVADDVVLLQNASLALEPALQSKTPLHQQGRYCKRRTRVDRRVPDTRTRERNNAYVARMIFGWRGSRCRSA
jgi:hypothetical protein